MLTAAGHAQVPEPELPRPGSVTVASVVGQATIVTGEQRKPLAAEDRLRVGSNVITGRRSQLTLVFSNGVQLDLRPESEVEIEEFGQATVTSSVKPAELKEEPTVSRTRLRLVRGEVGVVVKPLNAARGSSFIMTLPAGALRLRDGAFRAGVEFSDLGLGVCTLELQRGSADFELVGKSFAPVPLGQKLVFALEIEKSTGVVTVSEMPKATAPAGKLERGTSDASDDRPSGDAAKRESSSSAGKTTAVPATPAKAETKQR